MNNRQKIKNIPTAILSMAMVFSCVLSLGSNAQGQTIPDFPTASCHVTHVEDLASCGTLSVPLDWSDPDGEKIDLNIAILPPSGGQIDATPLFLLAGGPGQAATDAGRLIVVALRGVREGREVILVDQRGTGASAPFVCDVDDLPATASGKELTDRCMAGIPGDPRFFTSASFIKDIEAVRSAFGYELINLWGGSYGTRASLLYAREYPQYVRAMILDAVAPPSRSIFSNDAQTFSASLEKTFQACADDADCSAAFGNVAEKFDTLRQNLDQAPQKVAFSDTQPEIEIKGREFTESLRGALYSPDTSAMIPFVIDRALAGDLDPWRAIADNGIISDVSIGLLLSVQCAEEAPRAVNDANDTVYFAPAFDHTLKEACENWETASYPEGFGSPVTVDIPTLLLSGALDPITPPAFAEEAAETLANSKHLVAQAGGHSITAFGCVPLLIEEFLNDLDLAAIDGSCLDEISRPPFILSPSGPNP